MSSLQHFIRVLSPGAPERRPWQRHEMEQPGSRSHAPTGRLPSAYLLGLVLPALTAALMIPFRADYDATTAIVLLVPVVAVAAFGATGPAVLAAIVAVLAYDVALTEPYYSWHIDDHENVVAAIAVGVVALVVGVLSSRLARVNARDAVRRDELHHLVEFAKAIVEHDAPAALEDEASRHITALLKLRDCQWQPGGRGTSAPLLLPDGNVMGHLTALNTDRARLPRIVELPAEAGETKLGCFILTSGPDHVSSFEERLTAVTIASLFAATVVRLARTP